ncbi:MAG: hypothetical protein ABR985_18515 [Methanotrichaceae archaeon]|jgi:hypothetical protein
MIPVMFDLTCERDERVELVEIDNEDVTEDSEEIQEAVNDFHRQGWEVRGVYIPKKVG